jgi:hypothetical protein
LAQDTGVQWVAVSNNQFGTTSYLAPKSTPPVALTLGATPTAVAMAFFVRYGAVFEMSDPASELVPENSGTSQGLQFASFTQTEDGAAVFGTRLTMVFDAAGHIALVSGLYIPRLYGFATKAAVSPAVAAAKAEADMSTRYPASLLVSLELTPPPELVIYTLGATPELAYTFVVSYASDTATDTSARERVVVNYVVDADSGAIIASTDATQTQVPKAASVAPLTASGYGEMPGASPEYFPALESVDAGTPEETDFVIRDGPRFGGRSPPYPDTESAAQFSGVRSPEEHD